MKVRGKGKDVKVTLTADEALLLHSLASGDLAGTTVEAAALRLENVWVYDIEWLIQEAQFSR